RAVRRGTIGEGPAPHSAMSPPQTSQVDSLTDRGTPPARFPLRQHYAGFVPLWLQISQRPRLARSSLTTAPSQFPRHPAVLLNVRYMPTEFDSRSRWLCLSQ